MSVPHLDTRWIEGRRALLFGPYAGFSTRFLKQGSLWDLAGSVKPFNLLPTLQVGASNFSLVRYLVGQVLQSQAQRLQSLREEGGTAVELVQAVAGGGVPIERVVTYPGDARQRAELLMALRPSGGFAAGQAVVTRVALLAGKGPACLHIYQSSQPV